MNERIKELADRAGEYADFESGLCTDEFLEKFTELIVKECARVARNANLEDVEGGDSAVLRAVGEQIEKHF